jgi:CSLREA domain-containing protein
MRLGGMAGILVVLLPAAVSAATFTVTTTADLPDLLPGDGLCVTAAASCSLRAAIEEANTTAAPDTIAFAVPGPGVHTFQTATLPAMTQPVVVDGFTQPGAQPNTNATGGLNADLRIELTGGLRFQTAGATVRGIVSNGGTLDFEAGPGAGGVIVEGCYVGTDATGTVARNGGSVGVAVDVPGGPIRIGGSAAHQRNVIAGSGGATCVAIVCGSSPCPAGSIVAGNLIGTNAAGTAALVSAVGVTAELAGGLRVGGMAPNEGNLVSGVGMGIVIPRTPSGHPPVAIQGNRIGVDASGTQAIPNGFGISVGYQCSTIPDCMGGSATIGGAGAAANLVAHNQRGLSIQGGIVTINGNRISQNDTGIYMLRVGPGLTTVDIAANEIRDNASYAAWVRRSNYSEITFSGNVITGNGGGILVEPDTLPTGTVRFVSNSIHDNVSLGIDLNANAIPGGDGVTPNDPMDADFGPNDLQNHPSLATACVSAGGATVSGTLHTIPSSTATIELFRNSSCDPLGHGEGEFPAGMTGVTADAAGNASFSLLAAGALPGEFITATATNADGRTSEFSRCLRVVAPPFALPISGPQGVCSGVPFALDAASGAASYQWLRDGVPIPGATGARYPRPSAGPADAGTYTVQATICGSSVTSPPHPLSVVTCALTPVRLDVDRFGNGIFEPQETTARIEPRYRNDAGSPLAVTGTASLGGAAGATYALPYPDADYGSVSPGQVTDCFGASGLCYIAEIAGTRPQTHWDASFIETLSTGDPARHWLLHLGATFTDVPPSDTFYRFVETLTHHSVTGGCTEWTFCPVAPTTREQMAVFVLIAREGAGYRPPDCNPSTPLFADVPASSPFCRWIEELARRNVVSGCGGGSYCPTAAVSREQMSVFVLATKEAPGYTPPACVAGAETFADVPASSGFCPWIEELARRGVVAGCGNGNYCPAAAITRGEMSVFLTGTFGLLLYGP